MRPTVLALSNTGERAITSALFTCSSVACRGVAPRANAVSTYTIIQELHTLYPTKLDSGLRGLGKKGSHEKTTHKSRVKLLIFLKARLYINAYSRTVHLKGRETNKSMQMNNSMAPTQELSSNYTLIVFFFIFIHYVLRQTVLICFYKGLT